MLNFHPSLAYTKKTTAFENLSQGWIPAANSQQLKRDIGSRRRAQIFTGFTTCTLCKTRSREILEEASRRRNSA